MATTPLTRTLTTAYPTPRQGGFFFFFFAKMTRMIALLAAAIWWQKQVFWRPGKNPQRGW